jgi:hypothetical protein
MDGKILQCLASHNTEPLNELIQTSTQETLYTVLTQIWELLVTSVDNGSADDKKTAMIIL